MSPADDIDAIQLTPDPDKLLAYHRQQLSAMLDGELSPDEAKFMLRRLQHDGELAACWDRWQVCGDMLRGQHHALLPSDFAARVARGIAEPAPVERVASPALASSGRRLRWGGGAALAASVALAAVFAPRLFTGDADLAPYPAQSPVLASAGVAGGGDVPVAGAAADDAAAPSEAPSAIDLAPVALATALAAAEAPRRNAERRARSQPQAVRVAASQATSLPAANDVAMASAAPALALVDPQSAFPAPVPLQSRPWPRAVLPGATDSAFSVGYGQLSASLQPQDEGYDPRFLPRSATPLILLPGTAVADDDGNPAAPRPESVTP